MSSQATNTDVVLESMDLETLNALKNWLRNEIEVKHRRYRLRTVTDSFVGKEAVHWMVSNSVCPIKTIETALRLGNMMIKRGLIRCCDPNSSAFRNENILYQFIGMQDSVEAKLLVSDESPKSQNNFSIQVDNWVVATGASGSVVRGQCKFRGSVKFAEGEWVGLELQEAQGHHSGSVDQERYFECAENRGVFVRLEQCVRDHLYEEALLAKNYDSVKLNDLWSEINSKFYSKVVQPVDPRSPKPPNSTRFVCISDTHDLHEYMKELPAGDVLLHSGDFSMSGKPQCVSNFNAYLASLPHPVKIVIAGNHDMTFDEDTYIGRGGWKRCHHGEPYDCKSIKALLTNCIYLEDELYVHNGIRIYGSPWQPEYNGYAFGLERGTNSRKKWSRVPDEVDILMTHGPPFGHGDKTKENEHVGCVDLAQTVTRRVKPRFHVFGHVHEGYGITTNSETTFVNAATCNFSYNRKKLNAPIVFDFIHPPPPSPTNISQDSSFLSSRTDMPDFPEENKISATDTNLVERIADFLETVSSSLPAEPKAALSRTTSWACFDPTARSSFSPVSLGLELSDLSASALSKRNPHKLQTPSGKVQLTSAHDFYFHSIGKSID